MPQYKNNSDLPESVKDNLPEHAQDIYRESFTSAWKQYKDTSERRDRKSREETAHSVAWAAVKKSYTKDENGTWIER